MNAQQILDSLIARTKADAAVHGSSICHAQWGSLTTIRCHVVNGRAYLATRLHNRISKAALLQWMQDNTPDTSREEADNAIAQRIADDERIADGGVYTPANYPTVMDAYHEVAAAIQARLFQADKGTPEYVDLCEQLASVADDCDDAALRGLLDQPARNHISADIVALIPAWPTTQEGLDLMEEAQTETIERDLEFASYYARKAHTCSIDAVLALKVGRRDIAQQLRGMRDVYKHKARHLYNGVHYGNLFIPFGGV